MTSSGQATNGPASSVSADANYNGFLPNTFVDATTQASMFEYFTFTGPISQIFKIVVTANATVSSGSQDPFLGFRTDGTLDLGPVDIFGQVLGVLAGGEDVLLPTDASRTLTATFLGSDLNGLNILYFSLFARAEVAGDTGPVDLDPIAFASLTIDNPQISFYDANNTDISGLFSVTYDPGPAPTTVPEPASLTLLATGFAGVAGVVRRKRRAALGSN